MLDIVRRSLEAHFDKNLVSELLESYQDAKHNFFLGGLRLSEVESGRFCEAAYRILEQAVHTKFTPLNRKLDTDAVILKLANLPRGNFSDSIRLHIPRALRVVYDVRNNRDAAHLADGIDPNVQDATLVVSVLDWVLAELVRIYHQVPAADAQQIVDSLVTRRVPAVQDFHGFLKNLRAELQASDWVLLLLYERDSAGATFNEIEQWVHPKMRPNLRRTLYRLVHDRAYLHAVADHYTITKSGIAEVERRNLHRID